MFGKRHSETAKSIQREARLNQRFDHKSTSIEKKVIEQLVAAGIRVNSQFRVENYLYDVYIDGSNMLIECDGDYWHSLPGAKLRDKLKDECAERNGLRLIRIPEHRIRSDDFNILNEIGGDKNGKS